MTPSPGGLALIGNGRDFRTVSPDTATSLILDMKSMVVAVPPPERLFGIFTENEAEWDQVTTQAAVFNGGNQFVRNMVDVPIWTRPAGEWNVRPCFIQDGPGPFPQAVIDAAPKWSLLCKECYWYADEPVLADAEARWYVEAIDLAQRWPYDMGAILQTYTMNGLRTIEQVQQIAAAGITHLNARTPRWKAALTFAWDRADGGQIPALAALQTTVISQTPGWPSFEPVEHPIPPVTYRSTTLMAAADQIVDVIHSLGLVKSQAAGMTRLGFTCPDGTKNCVASVHVNPDGSVTIIAFGQDHDNPTEQFYIDPKYPDRATAKVNGVYYTFLLVDISQFPGN